MACRRPRSVKLAALALLLVASPVVAQPAPTIGPASPERDRGWVAFGLGLGQPYGLAGAVTASFGRERVIQAGYHVNGGFFSGSTNAVHVGGGLSRVGRWDRLAVAAGPAFVWGRRTGAAPGFTTVGAVVSAQAMVTPLTELGLGLSAFANLNPVRSGYGVALTFVLEGNK